MLLKISEMPENTRLCKVLPADRIKIKCSEVDEAKLAGMFTADEISALTNVSWRMIRACLHDDGVGLAAPQIGVMKRMFIIRESEDCFKLFINPRYTIDINSNSEIGIEGCLSVPGKSLPVIRATTICAEWSEIDSETKQPIRRSQLIEGFKARVFQHENDHLDGISILDRTKAVKQPK